MAPFVLEDRVRTGIKEIDTAHERLLTGLESLVAAVRHDCAQKHVTEFLSLLEFLVSEHFNDEECAMRRTGYPALLTHIIQHQSLTTSFHTLAGEYKKHGYNKKFVIRLGNFMSIWMSDHMYKYDLHMAHWLQDAEQNQLHHEA